MRIDHLQNGSRSVLEPHTRRVPRRTHGVGLTEPQPPLLALLGHETRYPLEPLIVRQIGLRHSGLTIALARGGRDRPAHGPARLRRLPPPRLPTALERS